MVVATGDVVLTDVVAGAVVVSSTIYYKDLANFELFYVV